MEDKKKHAPGRKQTGDGKEKNPDGILTRQSKQSGTGTDSTGREKVEEAVKKSEEYFRAITENISDIIIIVDKKGVINYISPSIERFVGYKPEEIVGKSAFGFIHPADLPRAAVDFAKAIITKETNIPNSFSVRHKDGSERILEGLGKNLLDNPAVAGFVMNVRDVTDRKKAEEIIKSIAKFPDENPNPVLRIGSDGMVLYANGPAESLLCSLDSAVGKPFPVQWKVWIAKARANQAIYTTDAEYAGRIYTLDIVPVKESGYAHVYIRNITERKKAEEKIRYQAHLLENVSDYVISTDMNFKVVSWNKAAEKTLGWKEEEAIGKSMTEIAKPEYIDCTRDELIKKLLEEGYWSGEAIHRHRNGTKVNILASVSLLKDDTGKPIGVVAVNKDITERKKMGEALSESEEGFRLLYVTSRDALMTLESPSWKFTAGNPATVEMFRTKDEKEFTSLPPWELSPQYQPDWQISSAKAKKMISEAMEKGSNFFEWTHRRADGEDFPATVLLTKFKFKGKDVVQATVRDITAQKKAEAEQEKLHTQSKERLVMIQKQNIQLVALQKRLKQYANKLETKVKRLEESKLDLTDKERLVFYALVACPDMNDRELAEQTGLKRSTVTAIKNRLKEEKLYQEINIPDLAALGCGLMTSIYGKFNMEYGEIRRMREKIMSADVVFAHTTDTGFFALTATKDLVSFHKDMGPSITFAAKTKVFKDYPSIVHFPLELSIIQEFFNFAPALRESFSMTEHFTQKPAREKAERQPLTKNVKETLYALVKHPEASTVELAKMLRLTRGTVSRIRNDLFRQGIVKKLILPDIKRLNYAFSAVYHFKHVPGMTADIFKKILHSFKAQDPIAHIALMGAMESMGGMLFRDGREHAEFMSSLIREMKAEGLVTEDPAECILPLQETRQFMFSFAPLTKKMLGIEKEI